MNCPVLRPGAGNENSNELPRKGFAALCAGGRPGTVSLVRNGVSGKLDKL